MRDPISETAHYVATVGQGGAGLLLVQHGSTGEPGWVGVMWNGRGEEARRRPTLRLERAGRARPRAWHLLRAVVARLLGLSR